MSELESAEQYVRAHELIESMRAERRPEREAGSEEEARLSATAALLRAAAPGSGAVDPIFAERLFARLEAEQAALTTGSAATQPRVTAQAPASPQSPAAAAAAPGQPSQAPIPVRQVGLSRRRALLGGLGAAAAALTGAAVTAAIEQSGKQQPPAPPASSLVIPGRGTWVAIATLDAMPVGAVKRFEAGAVIGYLQHTASGFMALSGVCTHMACLLQWNAGDKTFDCPCHGGRFLSNGTAAPGGRYDYVINGNMIGGFGAIAWPSEYGVTGVMTFMVNQQGKIYQKDLGEDTDLAAAALQSYDLDATWTLTKDKGDEE